MTNRRKRRLLAWIAAVCAVGAATADAASYKCKDADGNWSEAACKAQSAPPPAQAPAAAGTRAPAPGSMVTEPMKPPPRDTVEACSASLENDSGFDRASAQSICHSRPIESFYMCIYHLTTFNIQREDALRTCLSNSSKAVINCIYQGTRDIHADNQAVMSGCLSSAH